jgi:hypothetical protein
MTRGLVVVRHTGSTRRLRVGLALGVAVALSILLFPSASAIGDETTCAHGTNQAVTAGVVTATGCWTQATVSGATVYTADFADNEEGIDLNGFVVTGKDGDGLQINATTRAVTSITIATGNATSVQLNSRNWPTQGSITPLGDKATISFQAPTNQPLTLDTLHLGKGSIEGALISLLPVFGQIETNVVLEPGGGGSMDLTISLAGIFTLKDKPQSLTIALPTEPEEGTKFDGFDLHLKEITGIAGINIYDLEAQYSASKKIIAGQLSIGFPFMPEGKGITAGFAMQNGFITSITVGVHTKIPFGPGTLTDITGTFSTAGVAPLDFNGWCKSIGYESAVTVGGDKGPNAYTHWKCHKGSTNDSVDVAKACQWETGETAGSARYTDPNDASSWQCVGTTFGYNNWRPQSTDLAAKADLEADFGPSVQLPVVGDVSAVHAHASLEVAYALNQFVLKLHGDISLLRIPMGSAYFELYSNAGVKFGGAFGLGIPSFKNNENDPFYVGARVDGWVGGGKWQVQGRGRLTILGIRLADGSVLINDRGLGGCGTLFAGTIFAIGGGGFHNWDGSGTAFAPNTCGLASYEEQFPLGAAATAASARTFTLRGQKTILSVRGDGGAPQFELRAGNGRIIRTPATARPIMGRDYAVAIDRANKTTYVILARARGTWTIRPYPGSVTITSVKAAGIAPQNRITAKVEGAGTTRTLVYRSLRLPNTRLQFLEQLPNGTKLPILNTAAASGRRRFRVETGTGYGTRKLLVVVTQGIGFGQSAVLARYRVSPPPPLPASGFLDATRDGFAVYTAWNRVKSASGYFVQVSTRQHGRVVASFARQVSARTTTLWIPTYPALPGRSTVTVWALNSDGKFGRPKNKSFFTAASALTLKAAAKLSVDSAFERGGAMHVITQCPAHQGHCQVQLTLVLKGRVIVRRGYQQTPGTLRTLRLQPTNPRLRRELARELNKPHGRVRVTCRIFRFAQPGSMSATGAT